MQRILQSGQRAWYTRHRSTLPTCATVWCANILLNLELSLQQRRKWRIIKRKAQQSRLVVNLESNRCSQPSSWSFDCPQSQLLHKMLAEMIALDDLPFNFVNNVGFRCFMQVVEPCYSLPSDRHLRDVLSGTAARSQNYRYTIASADSFDWYYQLSDYRFFALSSWP